MKLYISTKKMTFDEDDIEHEIIMLVRNNEFQGYDVLIEGDDKFIDDTFNDGEFRVREQETWNSFPLYEIIDGKIMNFDYTKYSYFTGTDRRMALAGKINELFNPPSELKLIRKTLKRILDHLGIVDKGFEKYNTKIEELINKNPKN